MGQVVGTPLIDPSLPTAPRDHLVGHCPLVEIQVNGVKVQCLVDTGSQVTLFSESLSKELFSAQCLQEAEAPWLTLRGANGLDIPYIGYLVTDLEIHGITVPQKGVVVVRDPCLGTHRALLGMNVITDCWEELFQARPIRTAPPAEKREWECIVADCRRVHTATSQGDREGTGRVACRYALSIPARSEAVIWARLPAQTYGPEDWVLVEPHLDCQIVEVARGLAVARRGRVAVRVRNVNLYPIHLYRHQRLARVTSVSLQQVREGGGVSFCQVSSTVVEVALTRVDQPMDFSGEGMPVHLLGEALRGEGLEESQTQQLQAFLAKWQHVFSSHDEDYGRTDIVKHQIPTGDAAPSRERYRPVPPTLYSEVRTLLRGMLEKGIIRESSSPWAAPIVLVRKKTGAWRFCVDYRRLNQVTKKDAFPLPRIEDSLTSLTQAAWYSTLDLASGYWQVQVEEGDREKTAFTTPFGLFEWDRMPFGLCNAPATFQRLMQRCLGGQLVDTTLVYLDDVIVYSPDFESHLQHLEQVFRAMEKYGLKLQPDKCQLFPKEVKFLGHCVSASGVSVDPEKVSVVQGWSAPKTVRQVRSFLGFVGYYRRFIKDFSKIAKPLNQLLVGSGRPRGRGSPPVAWDSACDVAFQRLKQELLQAPLHIVAMDYLTLGRPMDRFQNILVVTDLFTKYAWAIPTLDQTAVTTANALWKTVFQPFGCPETLHSDQGPNFESKVVQELCQLYGCKKTHTTPYHPQGNGGCERFNQTLLGLLGTLDMERQTNWVESLPALVQAYNNSVHSTTGYAPTYLMFGRHVRLPTDLLLGTAVAGEGSSLTDWVDRHHQRLHSAYKWVTDRINRAAAKNKRLYDRTAREAPLLPGERVLVRDNRRQGKGKLSDRWEALPYVVQCQQRPDQPVYTIRPEGKPGPGAGYTPKFNPPLPELSKAYGGGSSSPCGT